MPIQLKRIYEPPAKSDGVRVLVERLWPRGMKKEDAKLDDWVKEIAPSPALRKWYGHDQSKWDEFRKRYMRELDAPSDAVEHLAARVEGEMVTFLFASKEEVKNSANVLKAYLEARAAR